MAILSIGDFGLEYIVAKEIAIHDFRFFTFLPSNLINSLAHMLRPWYAKRNEAKMPSKRNAGRYNMKALLTGFSARAAAALPLVLLAACTVVPIEEDQARRAQRSGDFDAVKFVGEAWGGRIASQLQAQAVDYAALAPQLAKDLDAAGKSHGRQTTDGSPWSFIVRGEATVTAIKRDSGAGTVSLVPAAGGDPLTVLTGPVVLSSALRDALPMFDFNDFTDQLSFAAANKALNDKALAANAAALGRLKVGDKVRFVGALAVSGESPVRTLLPIRIEPAGG